jgi:hypothetical protein
MPFVKPVAGAKNWDVTLNAALDNLNTRVQGIETDATLQGIQGPQGVQGQNWCTRFSWCN